MLGGIAAILALGCTAGVGLAVGHVDAVTWSGAAAFGTVVGLTFLTIGVLAVVLAQVAATPGGARVLGFAAVGVAFGIRALADTRHAGWLNWLTPLGLRAVVGPIAENRWWPLAASLVVVLALAWFATFLADRREYDAGLIRRRDLRSARLNVHSCLGLTARLARQSILIWTVAVACIGTLFTAMGSGVVQQSQQDDLGGFLGSQLGTGNPIAGYFGYFGTVVGMTVTSFAVLSVLRGRQDEVDGLTDHVLATGVRRWAPLAWQVAVTAGGSLAILVVTGVLSALVAPTVMDGPDIAVRAFTYIIGQWPATMVAAGWTALLIGLWARLTWLACSPWVACSRYSVSSSVSHSPSATSASSSTCRTSPRRAQMSGASSSFSPSPPPPAFSAWSASPDATSSPASQLISRARVPAWPSGHGGVDRPLSRITFRTSSDGNSCSRYAVEAVLSAAAKRRERAACSTAPGRCRAALSWTTALLSSVSAMVSAICAKTWKIMSRVRASSARSSSRRTASFSMQLTMHDPRVCGYQRSPYR
jgi:hypothetical protein